MSVKPILFNAEMVLAILDGSKTVTRRVIKLKYSNTHIEWKNDKYGKRLIELQNDVEGETHGRNPDGSTWHKLLAYRELKAPFTKGDILYVRETWRVGAWDIGKQAIAFDYADGTCHREWIYIADREKFDKYVQQSESDARKAGLDKPKWEVGKAPTRWHPSIHMPKEAARIWLKVTDVRVERLQDITKEQAGKEGVSYATDNSGLMRIAQFIKLWNSTLKGTNLDKYSWNANPWVWVIEFERCEKPEEGSR